MACQSFPKTLTAYFIFFLHVIIFVCIFYRNQANFVQHFCFKVTVQQPTPLLVFPKQFLTLDIWALATFLFVKDVYIAHPSRAYSEPRQALYKMKLFGNKVCAGKYLMSAQSGKLNTRQTILTAKISATVSIFLFLL